MHSNSSVPFPRPPISRCPSHWMRTGSTQKTQRMSPHFMSLTQNLVRKFHNCPRTMRPRSIFLKTYFLCSDPADQTTAGLLSGLPSPAAHSTSTLTGRPRGMPRSRGPKSGLCFLLTALLLGFIQTRTVRRSPPLFHSLNGDHSCPSSSALQRHRKPAM